MRSAPSSRPQSPFGEPADIRDEQLGLGPSRRVGLRVYGRRDRRPALAESWPLVLHFHGGAFVGGSLDSGAVVARLLALAGAVVVSVDYPLAPGAPFPQPLEVGYRALLWAWAARVRLAGRRARLMVAGEEAGGNLAAALCAVARDRDAPPLAAQVLLSPMLDPCLGTGSARQAEAGLNGCRWAAGWRHYLGPGGEADHPYAVPGLARRMNGLPAALAITAPGDPFHDETLAYTRRLRAAGIAAEDCVMDGARIAPGSWDEVTTLEAPWIPRLLQRLRRFLQTG
ncbi:alpha/beta hydrolase [Aquabacterium sp. A7-Y]|uniref:alpha/beta hydrolase n=1 Tax=Aquabacterium sp. A7-Y TaxID=1349605 RepID=UPI00223CD8DF|nr:alpha/beta hydrolase [Aquabacterium sp. A7-Y]MCW7537129.1 alpha/beta hydrolase [Aquabacterium sp. A7-Y]